MKPIYMGVFGSLMLVASLMIGIFLYIHKLTPIWIMVSSLTAFLSGQAIYVADRLAAKNDRR